MAAPEIKLIRPLAGGGENARVELVQVGETLRVLKTHRVRNIAAEFLFQTEMKARGLPSLAIERHPALGPNQILLEYVEGSPTLGGRVTTDLCRRWGAAVGAMHAARAVGFETIDDAGRLGPANWSDFITRLINRVVEAQRRPESDLPRQLVDRAAHALAALAAYEPDHFVLTHGDLHLNNALIRGDEIVVFDKGRGVWTAPPAFDLCIVYGEGFPGARYGVPRDGDDDRLAAFLSGYGPVADDQEQWLDHFALVRALSRHPNPFVPDHRAIVEAVLERLA